MKNNFMCFVLITILPCLQMSCDNRNEVKKNVQSFIESLPSNTSPSLKLFLDSSYTNTVEFDNFSRIMSNSKDMLSKKLLKFNRIINISYRERVAIATCEYCYAYDVEGGPVYRTFLLRLIKEKDDWKIDGKYFEAIGSEWMRDDTISYSSATFENIHEAGLLSTVVKLFEYLNHKSNDDLSSLLNQDYKNHNVFSISATKNEDIFNKAEFLKIISSNYNKASTMATVKCLYSYPQIKDNAMTGWNYLTMDIKLVYENDKWKIDGDDFFKNNPVYLYNYKSIIPSM